MLERMLYSIAKLVIELYLDEKRSLMWRSDKNTALWDTRTHRQSVDYKQLNITTYIEAWYNVKIHRTIRRSDSLRVGFFCVFWALAAIYLEKYPLGITNKIPARRLVWEDLLNVHLDHQICSHSIFSYGVIWGSTGHVCNRILCVARGFLSIELSKKWLELYKTNFYGYFFLSSMHIFNLFIKLSWQQTT